MESIQSIFIASAVLMAMLAIARPHWLLRPSFAFACVMTIVINPAAAFVMKDGYPDAPLFDSLRFSAILLPIGIVGWVICTPYLSDVARTLRVACQDTDLTKGQTDRSDRIVTWICIAICGIVSIWYFAILPVQSTGLWAIIFSTEKATQAREDSLKLLDSISLKYAFSIATTTLVPIAVALILLRVRRGRQFSFVAVSLVGIYLLALAGITGARMPMGRVIISVVIAIALISRRRSRLLVLPLGGIAVVSMVAFLTLLRSGKGILDAGAGLVDGITNRAFVLPFETGLRSVQLASEQGFLNGANVRPYAILTGQPYFELPSEVYMRYFYGHSGAIESGSANTSFLFDFQAGFGIWQGWWIALMALGALDFGLLAFKRLRGLALPAILAAFLQISMFKLTSGAFTTALLTGGIGLVIALAIALPILLKQKTIDIAST